MNIYSDHPYRTLILGVLSACASTILGGTTVVFTRMIISQTDPLTLTFSRYGIAAFVLALLFFSYSRFPKFERRDLLVLGVIGLFMFAAFPFFMARALQDTTAARGGLIFATMPVLTMIMAAIFGIERLTRLKLAAVVCAVTGTIVALGENVGDVAPQALRGDILMILGMLCASTFNVFSGRYLKRYGTLPVLIYTMFIGAGMLFVLATIIEQPFSGGLAFDPTGWGLLLLLAIPGGTFMLYFWARALRVITPTQAAVTVGMNPLTAILLGAWILSEPITLRVIIGFALLFAAILLASRPTEKHTRVKVPS